MEAWLLLDQKRSNLGPNGLIQCFVAQSAFGHVKILLKEEVRFADIFWPFLADLSIADALQKCWSRGNYIIT